jgi:predicted anti-sigma-YlaC factor YlaD
MECKQASESMSLRLDGRLEGPDAGSLDAHLSTCYTCQVEWDGLQALDSLLTAAPTVHPPVRLRVQVMARLERRDRARRAIVGGTALALGTVALALLALAPALLNLMNAAGIAPALISGGPATVAQLLVFSRTMGRTMLVLLERFVVPLVSLGMCSLVMALALNSLWMGAVRRLYVKS